MTYNAEKYKLGKTEKKTVDSDEVVSIEEGTLGSFVKDWAKFDTQGTADKNQPAILVKTSCGSNLMMSLPKGIEAHPRSKLGQWIKAYGKAPHVGQVVTSTTNPDGFFEVVLQ